MRKKFPVIMAIIMAMSFTCCKSTENGNNENDAVKNNSSESEKKIVTVSALDMSPAFKTTIRSFNSQSSDFKIETKTYKDYNDDSGYTDAVTAFNIDLISGNLPDIVFISGNMPVKSYREKGIFADLYTYMDSDADFDRNDYLSNIYKLLETDGKLYSMIDSFYIDTLTGKASDIGNKKAFTWDEFNALILGKPDCVSPINDEYVSFTKQSFLQRMLFVNFQNYVDLYNGTCSFDNDDFHELLNMANSYPSERTEGNADFAHGDPVFMFNRLSNFYYYKLYENYFGEEIAFAAIPTADGKNGLCCGYYNQFAITENAAEKDGAWQFVKYLVTDYQETDYLITGDATTGIAGFPVRISTLDKLAEQAMKSTNMKIGNGNECINEQEKQKIIDLIYSTDSLRSFDSNIADIIYEESESYFSGQKSFNDVTAIIENRTRIYLSEIN